MKDLSETARSYFQRLLNEKDLTVCEELLAFDYVDHDAPAGTPTGPGPTKAFVSHLLTEVPDLLVSILDCVSGELEVLLTVQWEGSRASSGSSYKKVGTVRLRFNREGQIVERWSEYRQAQSGGVS